MVFGLFKGIKQAIQKVVQGLAKTRHLLGDAIRSLVGGSRRIDKNFLQELEDILLSADVGLPKSEAIIADLRKRFKEGEIAKGTDLMAFLHERLVQEMEFNAKPLALQSDGPTVILVVGVNGTGKTTSIAKLAKTFKDEGKSVLMAAGDTYRAAATEQLTIWSQRVGVDIVKQGAGADAAAVVFDALTAAKARAMQVVLIDTAGRLHNREDLMRELTKMRSVAQKVIPSAPHEVLLVIDATAGQNAIQQAKVFAGSTGVTGLILTKLDGTAKGGAALCIKQELGIPIRYIGVGEKMDDLEVFDAGVFVDGILGKE